MFKGEVHFFMKEYQKLSKVFLYSAILVFLMVLLGVFFPKQFGEVSGQIGSWIINTFGWYYMITMTFIVFFSLFLIFSPMGKLRLGKPDDEPEFKTISWLAMLFSAGMGIGPVFYGATEPMTHYLTPPNAKPETNAAIMDAMRSAFFHYGIHPWAMYGIVALSLAYFQFRKNEDGLISFYKDANLERRHLGLTLTPDKERMREYVSESRKDENYELDRKTTDDHVY